MLIDLNLEADEDDKDVSNNNNGVVDRTQPSVVIQNNCKCFCDVQGSKNSVSHCSCHVVAIII